MIISFVIPGRISGKGRARYANRGKFVSVYTPAKTRKEEARITNCACQAMRGHPPLEGPLALTLRIFLSPPKSWSRKKREAAKYVITRPDCDNRIKEILDAANEVLWLDDSQVCDIDAKQRYTLDAERMEITVQTLE